jgi:XTP/dITP diphosphohydrolase
MILKQERKTIEEIIFVTGNEEKFLTAKKYFDKTKLNLVRKKIECPEIQDMNVSNVVKFSVQYMAEKLQKPVIKSDQGFYIEALNGFPGAYMHDVEATIGKEGFKRIMEGITNRKVKYVEALAFCIPGEEPVVFTEEKYGTLAKDFEGDKSHGIDFLFIMEGEKHTVSCFQKEKRIELYDCNIWPKMI